MKSPILALMLSCLLFAGCEKIDDLTKFTHEKNQTIEVPSFIGINLPFNIQIRDHHYTFEKAYSLEGYQKHFVEHARLTNLEISVITPNSGDLSFLESVIIYISANDLPEIPVAWEDNIPGNFGTMIELDVSEYDLRDYLKKEEFDLKVSVIFDEFILQDHEINIHSVFDVDARVMGI